MPRRDSHIWIVDDDDAVRDSLSMLLQSHGFAVRECESALKFLAEHEQHPTDYVCLVLDLHMPGMNGLELLDILKARHFEVPTVLMTGRSDRTLRARARLAGAAVVLDKPILEEDLIAAIALATRQRPKGVPMSLKTIRLELARSKDHPQGDPDHGYVFRAPLNPNGHIDAHCWDTVHDLCVVHRFEHGHEVESGLLQHQRGRWVFSYAPGDEDDEPIFRLSKHAFVPGEYISLTEHDGIERTFRVASVQDWHPVPATDTQTRTISSNRSVS